jgi:hypothetical protein
MSRAVLLMRSVETFMPDDAQHPVTPHAESRPTGNGRGPESRTRVEPGSRDRPATAVTEEDRRGQSSSATGSAVSPPEHAPQSEGTGDAAWALPRSTAAGEAQRDGEEIVDLYPGTRAGTAI